MTDEQTRDQIAQTTAEHIAANPGIEPGVIVHYPSPERPPTDIPAIKAALLDGRIWMSWLDDHVTAAMRRLHGDPTGDATHLA